MQNGATGTAMPRILGEFLPAQRAHGQVSAQSSASAKTAFDRPGIAGNVACVAGRPRRGVPVISEVELAARWLRGRIVAVTGTKGKSTTTVLAGRMFDEGGRRAVVGGNIGTGAIIGGAANVAYCQSNPGACRSVN